jgi:hypothetical protein
VYKEAHKYNKEKNWKSKNGDGKEEEQEGFKSYLSNG